MLSLTVPKFIVVAHCVMVLIEIVRVLARIEDSPREFRRPVRNRLAAKQRESESRDHCH